MGARSDTRAADTGGVANAPVFDEASTEVRRPALLQIPGGRVADTLQSEAVDQSELLVFTDTDIDQEGRYARQWIAVTTDRLLVIAEDGAVLTRLYISEITEFRSHAVVGSGILQARTEGYYADLVCYSNHLAQRFHLLAKKLDHLVHGEPFTVSEQDDINPRTCRTCGMTLEHEGETCPRCVSKGAVITRMLSLMKPYRGPALLMLSLLFVGIGLDMVPPQLTRYLVDNVLVTAQGPGEASPMPQSQLAIYLRMLVVVVLIQMSAQVFRMGINLVNGRITTRVGTALTNDIRQRLSKHLLQLSVSYYDRQQVGSLVGRVAYDTEAMHGFVSQFAGGFLFQFLMVIVVLVMMFNLNAKLAFFTLIPTPFVVLGSIIFWRHIYPRYYLFWEAASKQAGMLSGMLSGVRVVKAFGQEGREMDRFAGVSNNLLESRRTVDRNVVTFNPIMGLVFQFGGWIVWFVGGRDVLGAEMSLGQLMAFFSYLWMFYAPLGALTQFTNWLTSFATQAHRIFDILDTPIEIPDTSAPKHVSPAKGEITYDRVTFGYNRYAPIIKDVSLRIAPGELIGIVGKSGSGKTTLVNLLCRFYDVDEGTVSLDGVDVRDVPKEELRAEIGVVLQEPFLFRGSIHDNLCYGRPDTDIEQIIAAAKAGNCHDFIMGKPYGYDTWVGERGAGLSGGERQRVSIARVLLTDPRVLILDEATSNVDAESEAAIQAALAEVVKGRTTIAIAHRLSTLRNADRILVVDDGRIRESGTHQELIEKGGMYARLVKIQGQMVASSGIDKLSVEAEAEAEREEAGRRESPLPDIRGHHPRWLTPANCRLYTSTQNSLHVEVYDEWVYGGVFALRCRPIRSPSQYISLRYFDAEKKELEVGLIRDLEAWPDADRHLLMQSLGKQYFVHRVTKIIKVDLLQNYLLFEVDTDRRRIEFAMPWQHSYAHDYGDGGKMLTDTHGNRFLVENVRNLPTAERDMFMRYVYW